MSKYTKKVATTEGVLKKPSQVDPPATQLVFEPATNSDSDLSELFSKINMNSKI